MEILKDIITIGIQSLIISATIAGHILLYRWVKRTLKDMK